MVELSVIVPFYNGSQFFVELLDSLFAIKAEKEIIIVDDGSREDESLFCQNVSKRYEKIRIIYQENGGIVSARNKGLSMAKGQYVLFVDQDDFVDAFVIDKCIQNAKNHNSDIVFWSTKHIFADGVEKDCDTIFCEENIKEKEADELLMKLLLRLSDRRLSRPGHIWQCLFKTQLLSANNIIFKKFVDIEDDFLFVTDAVSHANSIMLETEVGYYWRANSRSESHSIKYIDNYMKKFDALTNYLYMILTSKKISSEKLFLFMEQQQIEKCLGSILNDCQIINVSLKNRGRVYQELKKLKDNSILSSYSPPQYTHGFRKEIWEKMKKGKFIRAMLWAEVHSAGALVKRQAMRMKYGTK